MHIRKVMCVIDNRIYRVPAVCNAETTSALHVISRAFAAYTDIPLTDLLTL